MKRALIAASVLVVLTPGVAAAADKVPVTVKVKDCDGCSLTATWSKGGKSSSKFNGKTVKVANGKATFQVPKGYWLYFTGTSPKAQVDAATVLVTQYVGKNAGDKVSKNQSMKLNDGAYFCMKAKKSTIKAQAALIKDGRFKLLSLWANPQLAGLGSTLNDGINGVYGTQNTLLCAGQYY